jgi:hypothetical protein
MEQIRDQLQIAKIPTIIVRNGDDLNTVLAQRPV